MEAHSIENRDDLDMENTWECDLCWDTHSSEETECPCTVEIVVSDHHGMNMPSVFASTYDPDQFTSGYTADQQEILLSYPIEEDYSADDDFVEAFELYDATWRDVVEHARIISEEDHTESWLVLDEGRGVLLLTRAVTD